MIPSLRPHSARPCSPSAIDMGLFASPRRRVEHFLAQPETAARLRDLTWKRAETWPEESTLILEDEAVLELGHPSLGSLAFLLWQEDPLPRPEQVLLLGPDLSELQTRRASFGQVISVYGSFTDEYDCYQALRETIYETKLAGLMTRILPSRQTIWMRFNRAALEQGISLAHWGAALVRRLKAIDFVWGVRVLFITESRADLRRLESAGRETAGIAGALFKMSEERHYDCASCEFREVCEQVPDLRRLREKLQARRRG